MERLEVSCAVRPIYGSLGAKGLREPSHKNTLLLTVQILLTGCVNVCHGNQSASSTPVSQNYFTNTCTIILDLGKKKKEAVQQTLVLCD
jgi:hypothetical protein